jgi:LPXTG-motif cell wall-anchored protein
MLEIGGTYYIGVFRYDDEPWVLAALADRDSTSLTAFLSRTNTLQPVPPPEHGRSLRWFVIVGIGVIAVASLLTRRRRRSHGNEG